jgi:hypothetical protein
MMAMSLSTSHLQIIRMQQQCKVGQWPHQLHWFWHNGLIGRKDLVNHIGLGSHNNLVDFSYPNGLVGFISLVDCNDLVKHNGLVGRNDRVNHIGLDFIGHNGLIGFIGLGFIGFIDLSLFSLVGLIGFIGLGLVGLIGFSLVSLVGHSSLVSLIGFSGISLVGIIGLFSLGDFGIISLIGLSALSDSATSLAHRLIRLIGLVGLSTHWLCCHRLVDIKHTATHKVVPAQSSITKIADTVSIYYFTNSLLHVPSLMREKMW